MPLSRAIESVAARPDRVHAGSTYVFRVGPPEPFDSARFQLPVGVRVPPELAELWTLTGEMLLDVELPDRQSGVRLVAPDEVPSLHRNYLKYANSESRPGDLAIGLCCGDSDLILMRCDPNAADFGCILVCKLIEHRSKWPMVAASIESFLVTILTTSDSRYWES